MPGLKTNEREGTRAVLRHARLSPYKVREVLDLVRNKPVLEAEDILRFSERDAAFVVGKVLHSAIANAQNNEEQDPEELFVSACFADEGTTIKRWRPRARGRATRIRKRTSHITVIVSRLSEEDLERLRSRRRAEQLAQRARRVAGARRSQRDDGDERNRAERRHPTPVEAEEPEEPEATTGPAETDAGAEPAAETEATEAAGETEPAEATSETEPETAPETETARATETETETKPATDDAPTGDNERGDG
jgi:large subunit ribosomal protein L22